MRVHAKFMLTISVPRVAEPRRGQSPMELSWRIILQRGASHRTRRAQNSKYTSKRGSDRLVSYRTRIRR